MQPSESISKTKRATWGRRLLWIGCGLPPLAMLICYFGAWSDPRWITWPQFSALAYPIILLLNLVVLVPLFFRGRKLFYLSLVILLAGSKLHFSYFTVPFGQGEPSSPLKVLSFNVRLFDYYDWSESENTRDSIMAFLASADADVMCLQEFYLDTRENSFNTLDTLRDLMPGIHFRTHLTHEFHGQYFGLVTFSRFPILASGEVNFSSDPNNSCLWTDLLKDGDTIRVFNMHLGSIRFQHADYEFLGTQDENAGPSKKQEQASILPRLSNAFERRAEQCRVLLGHISASPYPCIVMGDLNDTPASNAYWTLREELDDAFVGSTWGNQRTYIGKFPNYRIDYILYSEPLVSKDFTTHYVDLSDHYPITSQVGL